MIKRKGFTLIELVVVIMIIAILGAVAAPRLMGTRQTAVDAGLMKTLANLRNAVSIFASENGGALPGATDGLPATFIADLVPYLRGPFPNCPVGAPTTPAGILMVTVGNAPLVGAAAPAEGWTYNTNTGEFIANFNGATVTNPTMTYDQL